MPASTLTTTVEALNFSGDVVGSMTLALDSHQQTNQNPLPQLIESNGVWTQPAPTWTQCASFSPNSATDAVLDFVAVISGVVAGTPRFTRCRGERGFPRVHVTWNATSSRSEQHRRQRHPLEGVRGTQWVQVFGPSADPNATGADPTITLAADRKSGTVDTWPGSETSVIPQTSASTVVHVRGSWRCG